MSYLKTLVTKAGTLIGVRRKLNFIEGTNVTLTITDNVAADRIDVEIASTGGGSGLTQAQVEGLK